MSMWRPRVQRTGRDPLYRRLVDAMAADIAAGGLRPGDRLPPQRDLAHALSISVGAVTRAYEEAARQGLIHAHVGRGSFVSDRRPEAPDGQIDLSINTAPALLSGPAFADAFPSARQVAALRDRFGYLPPCGLEVDRRAAAAWLDASAGFADLDWRRIVCCNGAQGAMALAFASVCRPGDAVLCEAATFGGARILAGQVGVRLVGVDIDGEGIRPDALDRAAAETGARVVYVLPTLQNPTARTAGASRREDIVRVARARDLWIVEDDVYALYARELGLSPLAALAPERTFYASSLSKTLAPGLRAGFLVAPPDLLDRVVQAVRALTHSPPGLGAAIATHWIESGRAADMAREVCAEMHARCAAAGQALGASLQLPRRGTSLHGWMPMPELDAERVAGRALRAGLRLTPPGGHAVAGASPVTGLRLCLGGAPNRAVLDLALAILRDALVGGTEAEPPPL